MRCFRVFVLTFDFRTVVEVRVVLRGWRELLGLPGYRPGLPTCSAFYAAPYVVCFADLLMYFGYWSGLLAAEARCA